MSFVSERETLEDRFYNEWGSESPVAWVNIDYDPAPETPFVEFHVSSGSGGVHAGFGTKKLTRRFGIIGINVFTPINSGTNTGRALADTAAAIFRNSEGGGWQGNNITCRAASIVESGSNEEWYRHSVTIPYYINETY